MDINYQNSYITYELIQSQKYKWAMVLLVKLLLGRLIVIIIIMLVQSSQHIPPVIRNSKRKVALTKYNPLILVVSEDFSYLNYFTQTILKLHQYPYEIKRAKGKYLMNYTLPLICYEDNILSKDNLVEFICDVQLSNLDIAQYFERKQNIKRIYRSWYSVFHNKARFQQKGDLSKFTRFDSNNQIYEQLMKFSRDVVNKGYQRIFQNYSEDRLNIEAILMVDITDTILRDCAKQSCDYILRGYFSQQIDYVLKYKVKVEEEPEPMRMEEESLNFILLDGEKKALPQFPKASLNLKWFSGALVGLILIFGKWAH